MIDILKYSEYALDSEYSTVLNMLGLHMVLCILKILSILNVLSSEYAKVLNV